MVLLYDYDFYEHQNTTEKSTLTTPYIKIKRHGRRMPF